VDGGDAVLAQGAVGWCDAAGLLAAAATATQQPRSALPDATLHMGTMVLTLPQLLAGLQAQPNQLMPPLAEEHCSIREGGARALTLRVEFPPPPPPPHMPAPAAPAATPAAPAPALARQQQAAAGTKAKGPYVLVEIQSDLQRTLYKVTPVERVTAFPIDKRRGTVP